MAEECFVIMTNVTNVTEMSHALFLMVEKTGLRPKCTTQTPQCMVVSTVASQQEFSNVCVGSLQLLQQYKDMGLRVTGDSVGVNNVSMNSCLSAYVTGW